MTLRRAAVSKVACSYVIFTYGGCDYIRASEKSHAELIAGFEAEFKLFEDELQSLKADGFIRTASRLSCGGTIGERPVCQGGGTISIIQTWRWRIILAPSADIERDPDPRATINLLNMECFNSSNTEYEVVD